MLTRQGFIEWYQRTRHQSARLFSLLTAEAYYLRPIRLRNPIVFYEGHLPAFSANTLLKKCLGLGAIDQRFDHFFERGIDPADEASAQPRVQGAWPDREVVQAYGRRVDAAIIDALGSPQFDPELRAHSDMAYTIIEHELMHQETLLYIWHELPHEYKIAPADYRAEIHPASRRPASGRVAVPAGTAQLGCAPLAIPFGWDNEFPELRVPVAAFEIDINKVSNGEFMAFVEAGGYRERPWWSAEGWAWLQEKSVSHPHFWQKTDNGWYWRGMFDYFALPSDWPVYVSHAEASAYAAWRGARLPSEAEYQRAAYGSPEGEARRYPWGDGVPDATRGNFDMRRFEPSPVGSSPAGASAWGVEDLVGNGWEWTATPFSGFPGFAPMAAYPEYSADFFDNRHYVLKGASPATPGALIRPTFRNWFRATYPYVYATFRTVRRSD